MTGHWLGRLASRRIAPASTLPDSRTWLHRLWHQPSSVLLIWIHNSDELADAMTTLPLPWQPVREVLIGQQQVFAPVQDRFLPPESPWLPLQQQQIAERNTDILLLSVHMLLGAVYTITGSSADMIGTTVFAPGINLYKPFARR